MDGLGVQKCGPHVGSLFSVFAGWMGRDGTAMDCVGVLLVIRSDQGFFYVYRDMAVRCHSEGCGTCTASDG